jgi:hypothetical protein
MAETVDPSSDQDEADQSDEAARPRSTRRRRLCVVLAIAVGCVVAFVGMTAVTGLGGPDWMRRYPYSELRDLAARVNQEAGDLRTPDDCWRTTPSKDGLKRDEGGPLRDIARVDHLRSRVVVRVYAAESGRIDATTRRAVDDRLNALFDAEPAYSWSMVKVEPSPDGWSPLVSCRLVTRGWITGF